MFFYFLLTGHVNNNLQEALLSTKLQTATKLITEPNHKLQALLVYKSLCSWQASEERDVLYPLRLSSNLIKENIIHLKEIWLPLSVHLP